MRNLSLLDSYRLMGPDIIKIFGSVGDETSGAFVMPSPVNGQPLRVIASSDEGWDHVSVSLVDRCPIWSEMEFIKRRFFRDDETAMQLHVPPDDHLNCHRYCLHLWRPLDREIPRPPPIMVAPPKEKT